MAQREIDTFKLKSFTTEPKFRRFVKRGAFISVNRAVEFMAHLWEVGLKKCSYETLEWEFIQYFGSNDKRTVERYLGRPEKVERHTGLSKVVRMNRMSGKIAQFEYLNERHIQAKKGLLEILGYISKFKEGSETRYLIHHERMPYYTVQATLESEAREVGNLLQEFGESSKVSKEDLRACKLEEETKYNEPILQGKECEKTVLEVVSPNQIETEGRIKKKEVIDCTHTNLEKISIQNCIQKDWIKEANDFLTKLQTATQIENSKANNNTLLERK
ncbi:MAG: hypothetical protein ACPLOC_08805 [Candidatus Bathyarchaeales archaeon]